MKKLLQISMMLAVALMLACEPTPTPDPNPGGGDSTETPDNPTPSADEYSLMGDFEENNWTTDIPLVEAGNYLVAQDVVFANANDEGLAFKVRKNKSWTTCYGSDGSSHKLGAAISLNGGSNVLVNGEVGVKYDFYFTVEPMTIWVMPDGMAPGDEVPEPEIPEPEAIEVTAVDIHCIYYGKEWGGQGYNYYVMLSDSGFDDEGYVIYNNSKNYYLDLYATAPAEESEYSLPLGTYTFDTEDTMEPGTMSTYGGALMAGAMDDGSEDVELYFTDGTVVISENKIEATLTLTNGEVHHIIYEGPISFSESDEDNTTTGWSQLSGDVDVSATEGYYSIEPYGDYYEIGSDNYMVNIYQGIDWELGIPTGFYLMLELLADGVNTTDCLGTYTPYDGTNTNNVFIPGYLEEYEGELYAYGCFALDVTDYLMGPIVDGTITIEAGEADGLLITIDCVDDCGNAITGTIAAAEMVDTASMVAPAKAARKSAPAHRSKLFDRRSGRKVVNR